MPVGDAAAEIAVLLTAVVIVVAASLAPRRAQPAAAVLALLGLGAAGVLLVVRLQDEPQLTFAGTWSLDHVTVWAELLIVAVAAITVVLSPEWLRTDARHGEWYAVVLFSTAGAMVATAMRVVNAVPYVVDAPAGLVTSVDLPLTVPRHALT